MEAVGFALLGLAVFVALASKKRMPAPPDGNKASAPPDGNAPPPQKPGAPPPVIPGMTAADWRALALEQILENSSRDLTYGADLSQPDVWEIRAPIPIWTSMQPPSVTTPNGFDAVLSASTLNDAGVTWEEYIASLWDRAAKIAGQGDGDGPAMNETVKSLLHEQLWYPASRISPDSLTPADMTNALQLLWGRFSQTHCVHQSSLDNAKYGGDAYAEAIAIQSACSIIYNRSALGLAEAKLASDNATANTVDFAVKGIAQAIPFLGSALASVGNAAVTAGYGEELSTDAERLAQARANQFSNNAIGNLRAFIGPVREVTYDKVTANSLVQDDTDSTGGSESPILSKNAAKPFFIRAMLLTHGMWCSDQLGCGAGLQDKIIARAKTYRALDLIGCLMFPDTGPRTGKYGYIYNYNTKWGPVFGSIFPPPTVDAGKIAGTNFVQTGASLLAALGIR